MFFLPFFHGNSVKADHGGEDNMYIYIYVHIYIYTRTIAILLHISRNLKCKTYLDPMANTTADGQHPAVRVRMNNTPYWDKLRLPPQTIETIQ